MRITSVSYRETRTFGEYQNATVELAVELEPGDDLDAAHADLVREVRGRLDDRVAIHEREADDRAERNRMDWSIESKRRDLEEITTKVDAAREAWERAKAFLQKHGVDPTRLDEIPF